jgi:hypothetical protein
MSWTFPAVPALTRNFLSPSGTEERFAYWKPTDPIVRQHPLHTIPGGASTSCSKLSEGS